MTTTPKIHLLVFEGCPNASRARENLKNALVKKGWPQKWEEVDLTSLDTPEKWRGFPSPSVLIDGSDVETGSHKAEGSASCNLLGAPTVEAILKCLI